MEGRGVMEAGWPPPRIFFVSSAPPPPHEIFYFGFPVGLQFLTGSDQITYISN